MNVFRNIKNASEERIFWLNKRRIIFYQLAYFLIIPLTFWVFSDAFFQRHFWGMTIGALAIFFSVACFVYACFALLDKKPGLVINSNGFFDNTTGVSVGVVLWSEVEQIQLNSIEGYEFISVFLKDAEQYANKGTFWAKALKRPNLWLCGTTINIGSFLLDVKKDEDLTEILQGFFRKSFENQDA